MGMEGVLGAAAGATPYGAAASALGSVASGVMSALNPPQPPDFSTKASNRYDPNINAANITGGFSQSFGSGGAGITATPSSDVNASATQRATAEGGQGNQFSGSAGNEGALSSLGSTGMIVVAAIVGVLVLIFLLRKR